MMKNAIILLILFALLPLSASAIEPISKWKFEGNVLDEMNIHNGNNYGGTFVSGKYGQAIYTTGYQYITAGNIASSPQGTMMAWIKPNNDYSVSQAVSAGFDNVGHDYTSRFSILMRSGDCPNGDWSTVLGDNINYQNICSQQTYNSANFPYDGWTHVAITYDGQYVKFYNNGILIKTVAQVVSAEGNAQPYSIARLGDYSTYYFRGTIDEVSIWNVALTETQINQEKNNESWWNEQPSGNLIVNPSFEVQVSMPENWDFVQEQTMPSWISDVAHTGNHSVKINANTTNVISGYPRTRNIEVQANTLYHASVWGKTENLAGTYKPRARVVELDINQNWIRQNNLPEFDCVDWCEKTLDFTTQSNTVYVYIYANIWNGEGTFYVDDVSMTTNAPIPTPTPTSSPTPTPTPTPTPPPANGTFYPSQCNGNKISDDGYICINNEPVFLLNMLQLCEGDSVGACNSAILNTPEWKATSETVLNTGDLTYKDLLESNGKYYSVGTDLRGTYNPQSHFLWWETWPNEPATEQWKIDNAFIQYNTIKAQNPDQLVMVVNWAWAPTGAGYNVGQIADIHGFDLFAHKDDYPQYDFLFYEKRDYVNNLIHNSLYVDAVDHMPIPVMTYIMASGNQWNEYGRIWYQYTKEQLRAEAYLQITAGSRGIMFWPYKNLITPEAGLSSNSAELQIYKDVMSEIASPEMQAVLTQHATHFSWIEEHAWDNFVTFSNNPDGALGRKYLSYRYYPSGHLIVVNIANSAVTTNINIQGITTGTATTIGTTRGGSTPGVVKNISGGSFSETFSPYEVNIYKIE